MDKEVTSSSALPAVLLPAPTGCPWLLPRIRRCLTKQVRAAVQRLKTSLPPSVRASLRPLVYLPNGDYIYWAPAFLVLKALAHLRAETIENGGWPPDQPLVSVIIPCYNYGKYIQNAVDSVLRQTWQDLEVIVVEGGSTDGKTRQQVQALEGGKVRCLYQRQRSNANTNRALGLAHARGKYVIFLDADDQLDVTFVEKAVYLLETTGVEVVTPHMGIVKDGGDGPSLRLSAGDAIRKTNGIPVPAIFRDNHCTIASAFRLPFIRAWHRAYYQ